MKTYLNWTQLETQVHLLCNKITEHVGPSDYYKGVYGIPRGGLIIAVMISHRLNIPYVDRLQTLYGERFLVVDDIADTGHTLQQMQAEVFKNADFATIHYNKESVVQPKYWVSEKSDRWIVYPWESAKAEAIQDYKLEEKTV